MSNPVAVHHGGTGEGHLYPCTWSQGKPPIKKRRGCCSLSLEACLSHLGNALPCHRKGKLLSARVRNGCLLGLLPSPEFPTLPASHRGDVQTSSCNPATGKVSVFFLLMLEGKLRAPCILSPLLTELHPDPLSIAVTKYLSSSSLDVYRKICLAHFERMKTQIAWCQPWS